MKNKISYETLGVFAGPFPAYNSSYQTPSNIKEIKRVQNSNFDIYVNREIIKQLGSEDFLIQEINLNPPANVPNENVIEPLVRLSLDYLQADARNESLFGFNVNDLSTPSENNTFINVSKKDQNIFIATAPNEGEELNFTEDFNEFDIIGFGNCYTIGYSASASVNSLPTAAMDFVASNVQYSKYDSATPPNNPLPAISGTYNPGDYYYELEKDEYVPETTALSSNDISGSFEPLSIGGGQLSGFYDMALQSYDIQISIDREDLYGFGSIYTYDRKLKFPCRGNLNISLLAREYETGNLASVFKEDKAYDINLLLRSTACNNDSFDESARATIIKYNIEKAVFERASSSMSIGGLTTVDLTFYFSLTSNHGFYVYSGEA